MTRDELVEALTVERFAPRPPVRCEKHTFLSETVATNYAQLVSMANRDGIARRAYRCKRCDNWHITRRPRPEGKVGGGAAVDPA